jgi:hypothetical protein
MQFNLRPGDFPPNELDHTLTRLNVALRQSRPVGVPLEIWFNPEGRSDEYDLTVDYNWDPANPNTNPVSTPAFARHRASSQVNWDESPTPMDQLEPFGTWRFRVRNEDAAAELIRQQENNQNALNLDWLEDILLMMEYNSNIEYRYAK